MTARDVSMEELRPRSRPERDFGLVVGVDHYPRFRSLQGGRGGRDRLPRLDVRSGARVLSPVL